MLGTLCTNIISFKSQLCASGTIIIPIFQMRNLSHRDVMSFSNQWQRQDLNLGLADAKVMLLSACSAQLRYRALLRGWG